MEIPEATTGLSSFFLEFKPCLSHVTSLPEVDIYARIQQNPILGCWNYLLVPEMVPEMVPYGSLFI